jgi:hypothetical protein
LAFLAAVAARGAGSGSKDEAPASLENFLRQEAYFPVSLQRDRGTSLLAPATLNGKALQLEVDTGCAFTIVDARRAPGAKTLGELKIKLHDSLLGEISDPSVAVLDDLAIGPAHFFHQPSRLEKLETSFGRFPFSGMIGMDFLVRNFCVLDCGRTRLFFRSEKPTPARASSIEQTLRASGFTPVPLLGRSRAMVEGKINDEPITWLVDTGASFTMLEEDMITHYQARRVQESSLGSNIPRDLEGIAGGLEGIGLGRHRLTAARVAKLTVGGRTWPNVAIGIIDIKLSQIETLRGAPKSDVCGFLGADLLLAHGAIIDFSSRILWLPPDPR